MTIDEKRIALERMCDARDECAGCVLEHTLACCFLATDLDGKYYMSDEGINAAYDLAFPESTQTIKDSGERREFTTGAVRDIQEGKGRCDLMPLDVVTTLIPAQGNHHRPMVYVAGFVSTGDTVSLHGALQWFYELRGWDLPTMLLEVAKHFEEGAKKYGEYNWQKGIPVKCYIDSAVRHYLKWLRGDKDEPHDRAFCWNIICAIWTCKHKPEINDYRKDNTDAEN